MGKMEQKKYRLFDILYRIAKGEEISVARLADEYNVDKKSISRDISEIKSFLCDSREKVDHLELVYSYRNRVYYPVHDDLLKNSELLAVLEVLIGSRAFQKQELLELIAKLKRYTSYQERKILEALIDKEMYHYKEVHHDCENVLEHIWNLVEAIHSENIITMEYIKMNRSVVERTVRPAAIVFSEYYFYLFAYDITGQNDTKETADLVLKHYRIDRIRRFVKHRNTLSLKTAQVPDEGELRNRLHNMFSGKDRRIRFEFTGPSIQAVLDRIPTAQVIGKQGNRYIVEAAVKGDGIIMKLLEQGDWVKVIAPAEFVEEMKEKIKSMYHLYE